VAGPLAPGTALDLGAGEGGDALWLAGRGWRVTAVDVSPTALDRLAARAAEAGVEVAVERHDLAATFPAGRFDLVSAQFLQSPIEFPRDDVLRRAAAAVAPGGLLLVVAHLTVPPWARAAPDDRAGHGHGHGHLPQFPTAEETLEELRRDPGWDGAAWTVEHAGAAERAITGPDGETATISDSLLALRRT
jgi:SAM-dependent methyltransferase